MRIEIFTPDGYQPIGKFVEKGVMKVREYAFSNGSKVRATDTHKFQKSDGEWVYAKDIRPGDKFISDKGTATLTMISYPWEEPVCDIEILHPNHRYFTNGISSHNTGGNALRYYLSARYISRFVSTLKEQVEDPLTGEVTEERVANVFKLQNIKNKLSDPYKSTKFVIRFGEGVDDYPMIYEALRSRGIITNNGSFMIYKSSTGEEVKILGKIAFNKELREKWYDDMIIQYKNVGASGVENLEDEDEESVNITESIDL